MPTDIRTATEADLPRLVEMARDMHAESPRYRHLDFSAEKTARAILTLLTHAEGVAVVAEKEGHIVGMLGGFVTEHFFGRDKVACDLGLYVVPDERGSSLAPRLVRAFESWAREAGAADCVMGVSTEVMAERTAALYERMGYVMSGFTMRKDLKHV